MQNCWFPTLNVQLNLDPPEEQTSEVIHLSGVSNAVTDTDLESKTTNNFCSNNPDLEDKENVENSICSVKKRKGLKLLVGKQPKSPPTPSQTKPSNANLKKVMKLPEISRKASVFVQPKKEYVRVSVEENVKMMSISTDILRNWFVDSKNSNSGESKATETPMLKLLDKFPQEKTDSRSLRRSASASVNSSRS